MCARDTVSELSRSAIVRATLSVRWKPRADNPRVSAAWRSSATPASSGIAVCSRSVAEQSAFVRTPLAPSDTNRARCLSRAAATRMRTSELPSVGQHRLAGTGRADHQEVVVAGGGDFEGSFGRFLAFDIAKVGSVTLCRKDVRLRPRQGLHALEVVDRATGDVARLGYRCPRSPRRLPGLTPPGR